MELHEFQITGAGPRVEGHRDSVTGRHWRVRRLAEHLACSTSRQQRPRGRQPPHLSVAADVGGTDADPVVLLQRHHVGVVEHADTGRGGHPFPQHPADFAPRGVARVQHPANAVRGFPSQGEPTVLVAIEAGAPLHQLLHIAAAVLNEDPHGFGNAEMIAGGDGVAFVQCRRVVITDGHRNAALRIAGVALPRICLGEDNDGAGFRQPECGAQTGHTAANDEKIALRGHGAILSLSAGAVAKVETHTARAALCIEHCALVSQSSPVRIDVNTASAASTLWVGEGLADQLTSLLESHRIGARRFVVSNPVVWRLHGEQLQRALGGAVEPILLPDGERYKNLQSVARIYDALIKGGADRGSVLIAIGGGVIGDTAGFAAATYLRGITLIQVPTTLLAQVDSSVGGKVGVNLPVGKNLVGAFHQPAIAVIDPLLLKTLPRREFRSGLYEVVKYGMIASRSLFDLIANDTRRVFNRDPNVLVPAIVESCRIKAHVVTEDERESGLRRTLNYGHTIGHALEAVTKYRVFRHGEAIAYGMLGAADLAVARGALAERERQALAKLIAKLGPLPSLADLSIPDVMAAIKRDKKVVHGRLHFVLAIEIGATMTIDDVTEEELRATLKRLGLVDHASSGPGTP